jgi:hypothetical protein
MKSKVLLAVLVGFLCVGNVFADNIKVGDQVKISWDGNANGGGPFTLTNISVNESFTTFCLEKNEFFTPGATYAVQNISTGAAAGGIAGGVNGVDPLDVRTAYVYYNYRVGNYTALSEYFTGTDQDLHTLQAAIWYFENEITSTDGLSDIDSNLYSFLVKISPTVSSGLGPVVVLNYTKGGVGGTQDMLAMVPEPTTMLLLGIGLIGIAGISRRKLFT